MLDPTPRTSPSRRLAPLLLSALLLPLLTLVAAPGASAARADDPPPVEDYARYDGQTTCKPRAKVGTKTLQAWAVKTYGGRAGGISRACNVGGASEHKEGRAFDWTLDATRKADAAAAQKFLDAIFAEGKNGDAHELARRMGVMYVIWDDTMYASYREFEPTPYVSSSCKGKPLKKCSATLRHRDHVHVSLSWPGARANTSWYDTPAARKAR